MCRNLRKVLAALALLGLLAGCSAQSNQTAQLLGQVQLEQSQHKLAQAVVDDLERTTTGLLSCQLVFAYDEQITCKDLDGYVMQSCSVSAGDRVEEGQELAFFSLPEDPRFKESLQNAIRTAEWELQAEKEAAARAVASAKADLAAAAAGSAQEKICRLKLEQAEAAYAAVSDEALVAARQALEEYEAAVAGKALLAPHAGTVEALQRFDGKPVTSQTEFCRLYSEDEVYLRADRVSEQAYRYGAQVKVYRASKYFCQGTVISSMDVYGTNNAAVIVALEEGADSKTLVESPTGITLSAVRLQLDEVLLLPKEAVRNDAGVYYVYLYQNDTLCRRYVQLGAEGKNSQGQTCVQILDGIEAGDWVVMD